MSQRSSPEHVKKQRKSDTSLAEPRPKKQRVSATDTKNLRDTKFSINMLGQVKKGPNDTKSTGAMSQGTSAQTMKQRAKVELSQEGILMKRIFLSVMNREKLEDIELLGEDDRLPEGELEEIGAKFAAKRHKAMQMQDMRAKKEDLMKQIKAIDVMMSELKYKEEPNSEPSSASDSEAPDDSEASDDREASNDSEASNDAEESSTDSEPEGKE